MSRTRLLSDVGRFAIVPLWLLLTDVSNTAIRLFALLAAKYADRDGACFPSRLRLAADLRARSKRTVDTAIDELERVGAVEVERRATKGLHQSNVYVLHYADPATRARGVADEGGAKICTTPGAEECATLAQLSARGVVQSVAPKPDLSDPDPSTPEGESFPPAALVELWNAIAVPAGLHACLELTPERATAATRLLKKHPDREFWRKVIERLAKASFCRGSNERGWIAGIDFLLRRSTITRALEGAYDDRDDRTSESARLRAKAATGPPPSRRDQENAREHRRKIGRCPHEPECETFHQCVGELARWWQQQRENPPTNGRTGAAAPGKYAGMVIRDEVSA